MATTLEQKREAKYIEIISKLNRQRRQGTNQIFDCGDLGFIHIWWYHQWESAWFIPSIEFKE